MGVEANKALVRRFYAEVWDNGNVSVAHEVFASDYVRHDLRPNQALPGPELARPRSPRISDEPSLTFDSRSI